jgi:hypothetical protein
MEHLLFLMSQEDRRSIMLLIGLRILEKKVMLIYKLVYLDIKQIAAEEKYRLNKRNNLPAKNISSTLKQQ